MSRFSVDVSNTHQASELAWEALRACNVANDARQFIFRFGSIPSRFERDDSGALVAVPLTHWRMRFRLNEIASFGRPTEHGWKPLAGVPGDVTNTVIATPDPQLPIVARLVEVPVLAPTGEVHDRPGYSPDARVFYEPSPGLPLLPVPDVPNRKQVVAARRLLTHELFKDFPFVGDAEKAHAVAMLLQPFLRDLIDGPTPLFLVEAPTPGTGKGLLVHAALWPATGIPVPAMTEGRDEDEWRKRITAKLRPSPQVVLIDNLGEHLDSAAVSSVLTAETWSDRILGTSYDAHLPNRCVWVATGNNPSLSSEMVRRSVRIRLDARQERPEDRDDWRHPDLLRWAAENRAHLVRAALTLARAWVVAGKPSGKRRLGSYEAWSDVTGGVLTVAGIPGFLDNLDQLRANARDEGSEFGVFLQAWHQQWGSTPLTVKELGDELAQTLPLPPGKDRNRQLGRALGQNVDRVYGELVLRRARKHHQVQRWRVEPA